MRFKDLALDDEWYVAPQTLAFVDWLIESQAAATSGAHTAMRVGTDEKLREARGLLGEADGFRKAINMLSRKAEG